MSISGRLTELIHQWEQWIENRPRPLILCPIRLLSLTLLLLLLTLTNLLAIARWPFSAIYRAWCAGRSPSKTGQPIHVDAPMLQQLQKGNALVLVDFWAEWCGPCLLLGAVLREFAAENPKDIVVAKVDTTLHPILARSFQVDALPTLVLLRDGAEIARHVGPLSPQRLRDLVKQESSQ